MSKDWPTELWEIFIEIDDVKQANIVDEFREYVERLEAENERLKEIILDHRTSRYFKQKPCGNKHFAEYQKQNRKELLEVLESEIKK